MVLVKRSKTWADSASASDVASHEHAGELQESVEREMEGTKTEVKITVMKKTSTVGSALYTLRYKNRGMSLRRKHSYLIAFDSILTALLGVTRSRVILFLSEDSYSQLAFAVRPLKSFL